jgi:hypothetical protein
MRINTGLTVSVNANTERWLSELRSGRAFGGRIYQTAVAAQLSRVQLLNPVGSAITVIARLLALGTSAAQGVNIAHYNTALTTLEATSRNLLSGGAAPVAELRRETNAVSAGSQFFSGNLQLSITLQIQGEWLTELGAGEGMICEGATLNDDLLAAFLWMEV